MDVQNDEARSKRSKDDQDLNLSNLSKLSDDSTGLGNIKSLLDGLAGVSEGFQNDHHTPVITETYDSTSQTMEVELSGNAKPSSSMCIIS